MVRGGSSVVLLLYLCVLAEVEAETDGQIQEEPSGNLSWRPRLFRESFEMVPVPG